MIVHEIVVTCSHPEVARAAVASIGGDFARRFSRDALRKNLSSGTLAAGLVRDFACKAGDRDWESLDEVTRGADMPILSGLRYILDRGMKQKREDAPSLWPSATKRSVDRCAPEWTASHPSQ